MVNGKCEIDSKIFCVNGKPQFPNSSVLGSDDSPVLGSDDSLP
jgi:hypothetical protein